MRQPLVGSIICCIICACAGSKQPEKPGGNSSQPAQRTTTMGLSTDFQAAASGALQFIGETLRKGPNDGNQAQFDADLNTARQKVRDARSKASTDPDKGAALLLMLLLAKDKERYQTLLMTKAGSLSYESVQSTIQDLYAAREGCAEELRGWLGMGTQSLDQLKGGACLAEARAAAAVLGAQ